MFGLWKSNGGLAGFPFATLLEKLDALEALEDGTFAADGGAGLEAVVLGHLEMRLNCSREADARGHFPHWQSEKREIFLIFRTAPVPDPSASPLVSELPPASPAPPASRRAFPLLARVRSPSPPRK